MAPISMEKRSLPNGSCVLETSCESAIFWEAKQADEASANEATVSVKTAQLPPRLTRREVEVLVVLCRPLVSDDPFPEPASVRRMALELFVTEAAIKQHLQNLYDKFAIPAEGERRVRLANEAIRCGAVTLALLATAVLTKSEQTPEVIRRRRPALQGVAGKFAAAGARSGVFGTEGRLENHQHTTKHPLASSTRS
jgi:hypothetical protein